MSTLIDKAIKDTEQAINPLSFCTVFIRDNISSLSLLINFKRDKNRKSRIQKLMAEETDKIFVFNKS